MVENFHSLEDKQEIIDSETIDEFAKELEGYLENYYSTEKTLVNI